MPFFCVIIGDLKIAWSCDDGLSASRLVSYLRAIWSTTNLLAFGIFSFFFQRTGLRMHFVHPCLCGQRHRSELKAVFSSHLKSGWCIPCYFQRAKQQICKRVSVLMRFENLIWWPKHRFCTARLGRRHLWKALRGRVCKVGRYEGNARWSNTKKVQ